MKKKSASQSAPARRSPSEGGFFNLRVLIGLFTVLAGVFLALVGFGTFSALGQAQQKPKIITDSKNPLVPDGFDCSKIHELGIDRQDNMRAGAIMIACGQARGGSASTFPELIQQLLPSPLAFGAGDVDLITGADVSPHVTQSETFSWANPDNPNQIVVAFNDSRDVFLSPINISGASVSTDGGTTFTRLTNAQGHSPFSNTLGDPVILFNKPTQTWFAIFLDIGCGGQGIGGYKSTTPWDPTSWTTHFCVHNGFSDDRESGWADNNSASPHFGNMYVSWNDFAVGGGALFVRVSTDNGGTWTAHQLTTGTPFIRDVQITGDVVTGDVYVAGMDEGGGGLTGPRSNKMYRSTDGGSTWTNTYNGPTFSGPGTGLCSNPYFATMFGTYWRHMGWGQPAAFNHVVSYVYAQHGAGADPGDVFYIRSTDSGGTFSTPLKLNTDTTTRPQWQPNLSVSPAGTLFAMWYDARETGSCGSPGANTPCYRMWARKSNDNGLSWLPDDMFSDVVTPLPAQLDPGIVDCYVGDYDYGSAVLTKHVTSWADGRVLIGGQSQQDAFTDRELVGFAVTTTVPACNSLISTQPTDFTVNLSDPALVSSVQASDFTVNGTPANSFTLSNGNATITFHYTSTPVVTQGLQTMHIAAGAILRATDSLPIFDFTCTFCYAITPLQVTTTVPPVGGTFSPPAPGDYTYDVNFNQAVDSASVQTSDLTLTGNTGGSVTAVSVSGSTATFTLHFNFGGSVTASIGAGAITAVGCNGNAAFSGTYTVEGCPSPDHYDIAQITASIVPGTTDIGNHCDDCTTTIALPFSYTLYDQTFNAVTLSSNGNAQFTTAATDYSNVCLPWTTHDYTILPYWDDLYTLNSGFGIFTSTSGSPPDRIFNIEWRNQYYPGTGQASFELRLYEGQTRFDVIYGTFTNGNTSATAGVQKNDTAFDQYFCNGSGGAATGAQSYTLPGCSPTPTPTPTATPTPSGIRLRAHVQMFNNRLVVHLKWDGAEGTSVDIFRNGVRIARVQNTGKYSDQLTIPGDYTYQVCEVGTGNCSNEARVRFTGL
jgi:hypothetical protein